MNNNIELGPPLGERNPVINSASAQDQHTNRQDFLTFIESTGLSEKDKDLIKGVYYDWISGN